MARYLEEAPDAGYIAVVKASRTDVLDVTRTTTSRYGIYNTRGVATSQAKKVAGRMERAGLKTDWWVMEAQTTWVRVNP